jgi:hypothetical protein
MEIPYSAVEKNLQKLLTGTERTGIVVSAS